MLQDRDVLFRFVSVVVMSIVLILAIMLEDGVIRILMIGILVVYNAFAFLNLIMDGSSNNQRPRPKKISNPNPNANPNPKLNPNSNPNFNSNNINKNNNVNNINNR